MQYSIPAHHDASAELLPTILSDEITFRSQLLARVRACELVLLEALDKRLYDAKRTTLPQIVNSLLRVVTLSEAIVERTKHLSVPGAKDQVSGLFAKHAVLRQQLQRLGVMDAHGALVTPAEAQVRDAGEERGAAVESEGERSGEEGV